MIIVPVGRPNPRKSFLAVLGELNLRAGLQLCLDAGDKSSYFAASNKWLDVAGGGYDFSFGDGATATTFPTFNGTLGAQTGNEYFSVDGGDYWTYDSSNEAWMNALHKASQSWSYASWVYCPSLPLPVSCEHVSTVDSDLGSAGSGVRLYHGSGNILTCDHFNGGGTFKTLALSSTALVASAWNFIGFGIVADGSGNMLVNVNCNARVADSLAPGGGAYPLTSNNASTVMALENDRANTNGPSASGTRRRAIAMWQGAGTSGLLTSAQFSLIKDRTEQIYASS